MLKSNHKKRLLLKLRLNKRLLRNKLLMKLLKPLELQTKRRLLLKKLRNKELQPKRQHRLLLMKLQLLKQLE